MNTLLKYTLSLLICVIPGKSFSGIYQDLPQIKSLYEEGNESVVRTIEGFEHKAKGYLEMPPLSVTAKKQVPPSGDKRDYYSLSTYWWPDSSQKDGLPYIRKDGLVNPEIYTIPERTSMGKMADAVECLCITYYMTGKEEYAAKAAQFLRTWFLDKKLGMNPNMAYSQMIPGHEELRGTGILDSRCLDNALNASELLISSKSWTASDRKQLKDWATAFCYWMEHSTHGQKEHAAKNNHGVWYDANHLMILAYLGETEKIKDVINNDLLVRLGNQIAEDGSLPAELVRTRSLHYSTFVVEAIMHADIVANSVGIELWKCTTPNGRKIISILDYLYPYFKNPSSWQHSQIDPYNTTRAAAPLLHAGMAIGNKSFVFTAYQIGIKPDYIKYTVLRDYMLIHNK